MTATKEYKSVVKEHTPGQPYAPADAMLNAEAAEGWELIGVAVVDGVYRNARYEIFYLERKPQPDPLPDLPDPSSDPLRLKRP